MWYECKAVTRLTFLYNSEYSFDGIEVDMENYAEAILRQICGEQSPDLPDWRYYILRSILFSATRIRGVSTKEHINMTADLALTDKGQLVAFMEQYGTSEAKNTLEPFFQLSDSRINTILKILREQFRSVISKQE